MKQKENYKKSKAFTATLLVCITDVAQMMCMFYILKKKVHFYYLQIKRMCERKRPLNSPYHCFPQTRPEDI